MSDMSLPGHNPGLAPGMTQVVVAGETYVLKDNNDEELELVGRDDPKVIDFLEAFDAWQSISNTLGHGHASAVAQFTVVLDKWRDMPDRVLTAMPSYRAGGVLIPGRSDVSLPHRHDH